MATYTRNNESINGSGGEMDYHHGTSAADLVSITNFTVVSGGSVTVPHNWSEYVATGGVFIYDAQEGNDTLTGRNVKIEDGTFELIGDKQNDNVSASNITQTGGRFGLYGGWQSDSVNVSNLTISGGAATASGDTDDKDTVSVSKVSMTGGTFDERSDGKQNVLTASEVTIQGGKFVERTTILERVGEDKFDSLSIVESLGGSNTLSANKISMTGGTLAVYSEGANNSIKISDVTMSGGGVASIRGGVIANVNGEQGKDTISVSNLYVKRPSYNSEGGEVSIYGGGSNNSVSVSNVSVSGDTSNTYSKDGFYISGGASNNTVSVENLTLDGAGRIYIEDGTSGGGKTSLKNITFGGNSYTTLKAKGDTVSLDGVNFAYSSYISLSGDGNISAQNITNTVGGGISMTGGANSADSISLENVTISSGNYSINGNGGNDTLIVDNVSMTGGNIYVIGGNGNANVSVTNIDKTGGYFDIDMGGSDSVASGNDTIFVENISNGSRAYFDIYARGGADSISIKNSSSSSTIQGSLRAYGGAGKDSIYVENISVTGYYSGSSIDGGADDDFISVKNSGVNIYGEDGKDTISVDGYGGNIDGGAGDDSISATNLTESINGNFYGGAGNDTIEFFDTWMPYYNAYSGGGAVTGDAGNDLITAKNATIHGTGFFGGEGNDTISVDNSTVTSGFRFYNGAGNDSISVSNITGNFSGDAMFYSEYSTYASDGNDTISLDNWTLTGDDSQRILINGNIFSVDNSSINGADSISIKNITAPNATFYVYGKGGNDTVSFENMTLGGLGTSYGDTYLGSGYIYGSFDSGNDSISFKNIEFYKGSSGKVTLNGGEGADTISVDDVTLGDENDGRYTQSHLTVTGGAGNDVLNVSNVSVTGSYSTGYILGDAGADKISVTDSNGVQITGGDGNDTIYFGGEVEATLTDLSASDVISLSGNYSQAYYKSDKNIFIYGTGVKVSLGGVSDVADISSVKIYNGSTQKTFGNFVSVLEWKLENGVASYGDLITISGLSSSASWSDLTVDGKAINTLDDEEIKASGKPVVISNNALDTSKTVSITSGYTLALASDVTDTPKDIPEHWEISAGNAAYLAKGLTAGFVSEGTSIYYQSEITGSAMVEVSGLSDSATADDISLNKKVVTVKNNALDSSKTVSITGSVYTLALGADVTDTPEDIPEHWEVSEGNAAYLAKGSTAGFVSEGTSIYYQSEITGSAMVEVSGLSDSATADDISLNKKVVTVKNNALDENNTVEISKGYALALGSDVEIGSTTAEGWSISSGVANYNTESATEGYILADNKISHIEELEAETLVTVSGLKKTATAKQLSIDKENNIVTVAQAATNKGTLSISEGYALALAKGTYSSVSVVGSEDADTIYTSGGSALISVGAGDDFISLASGTSKNTIIGGAGNDSITATKGSNVYKYASGDGSDFISGLTVKDTLNISSGEIESWSIEDNDLTLNIGSGSIKIADGAGTSITVLESGSKKAETFIYGENIKYDAKKTAATLAADFESAYTAEKTVVSIDGAAADSIQIIGNDKANMIIGGENSTLWGGKGNDTMTGGDGENIFIYGKNEGKDVITNYAEGDKISLGASITSVSVKSGKSSADVIFKSGTNTLTLKDAGGKKITTLDSLGAEATFIYESGKTYNADKTAVTLTAAFKGTLESGVVTVDGSAVASALNITGNDLDNVIYGGTKADSLNGGAGNDILTGGKGNDTFIASAGNDTLTDYEAGKDKIKIAASITGTEVDGNNVIFTTSEGSITVVDGVGQKIITTDSKNKAVTQIYEDGLTYDEKKTAVTLSSDFEGSYNSSVKADSTVISIDGAAADSVSIQGNAKANKITGGAGADTIFGGTGNDTLLGGDGADIFIFNAGKDVITDYAEEDKISIGGAISSVSASKNDVVIKSGSNTLTIKNGTGKKITTLDSLGAEATFIYEVGKTYNADKTAVTLTAAFKGTLESGVVTVDGSAVASALNITGNDLDNVIYGGTKADSLNGGAGNDILTGGKGNDTFIASAGNDVITDYTAGQDKIKFNGDFNWSISGNDVIFETAEGTVTVTNGKGKKIITLDSKNKATTETYSASSARTLDLILDNNFLTDGAQLSDITEQKFTVTEIQNYNSENFAQDSSILAYSEDK